MDANPAQMASPQDGNSTPPRIPVPASASPESREAAMILLQLANTPVPAQAPSLVSSQRTATLGRSLSPPCIFMPTSISPEQYWSDEAAPKQSILQQANAHEPAQTPFTVDLKELVKVESSHSPSPTLKSFSKYHMKRELEDTNLDHLLSFPTTPSAKFPTVPNKDIWDGDFKSWDFDQLPSHPPGSPREMSAIPDQQTPREDWENLVDWGEEPDLSPVPLAKIPPVWPYRRPGDGPLYMHNVPARCPETEPEHGLKPDSKNPFMGNEFPCDPDDGFREFAKSSLDAVFDLPDEPFGQTASKAKVEKTMCDMKRELDQVQRIRDQLWRDIELIDVVIGTGNELVQTMCRRVFLQAVNKRITRHQAWIYFRSFFGTRSRIHHQCRSLLSQGAVPFARESHRFKRYAREHLSEPDVFSKVVDELMLADMETKQDILTEMLRRKDLRDGVVMEEEPVKPGMFVVPQVPLSAGIKDLLVRLQSTGLPFNGALQMVSIFARV